jgi:8-oxo-dGTP pyrophosphatase MutT (NUDIX family)
MEKRITEHHLIPKAALMFCNNCGGKGHLFRTCKDPVLSCGIMLIDKPSLPVNASETKILMIRRKDSMSFAEFMRGKYDPTDTDYVNRLVSNMTIKEQASMVSQPFDYLWKQLWGDDRSSQDYINSKEKFDSLDKTKLMVDNLSTYTEPEWGFPKGKRIRGESDFDCAVREFTEETNISRESYMVFRNLLLEETFTGLNNIRYKHVYFVALLRSPENVNLSQRFTIMQRREISGISWKTFNECETLIRPHHVERMEMVLQLKSILETFESV